MKTFIQISPGGTTAHYKFQAESKPKWAPNIILIDVTGIKPEPQEGWAWDGQNFTPILYEPPPDSPQKKISDYKTQAVKLLAAFANGDESVKQQLQDIADAITAEEAKVKIKEK